MKKFRIGVSRCLLGEPVRYDGQHRRDPVIADALGRLFDFVGVCPEAECGFGIPRETVQLMGDPANPRLVTTLTCIDRTRQMRAWAERRIKELEKEDLHGFIFKARSPSCAMESIKVYSKRGGIAGKAPGIFARALMRHFPALPCEDECRLKDPERRENFIERVFTSGAFAAMPNRPSAVLRGTGIQGTPTANPSAAEPRRPLRTRAGPSPARRPPR
ncbi:MAG: DUF523 domain-containing protein [Planctomycetota bacterium]|mgnify:CR=1 FL=1